MRIYLKYILVIFIFLWTLGVFYMFFSNDSSNTSSGASRRIVQEGNLDKDLSFEAAKSIDKYKRDFDELKAQYRAEMKKAYSEIAELKTINENNQIMIAHLKYYIKHYYYIEM